MLFDRNVAGVFRSTMDGRMLDCNEALARVLGYDSRDEVLSLRAWDFYHQRSDREEILRLLEKNGALTQLRISLRRKDGSALLGVVNAAFIAGEGGERHLLGTIVEA